MDDKDNLVERLHLALSKHSVAAGEPLPASDGVSAADLALLAREGARRMLTPPAPVLIHSRNPSNHNIDANSRPLISFTTISSRLELVPHMVSSLLKQDASLHSINMYISTEPHLLDEGIPLDTRRLKLIHDMGVNIYSVPNIGPYRKQFYIIKQLQLAAASHDAVFVTVDDDVIYPPGIIRELAGICSERRCVASQRGRGIGFNERGFMRYSEFQPTTRNLSQYNLATGKNGIAYRLGFFPSDPLFYAGPMIAPTADDIWCKWITSYFCVKTFITQPDSAFEKSKDFMSVNEADKNSLFHRYNAKGSNDTAIEMMEAYFSHVLKKGFLNLHGADANGL